MHLGFEDGCFAWRAQSFAMHHTHTAYALLVSIANEGGEGQACFIAAQAVQVNFALNRPIALAQFARHFGANAGPSETQGLIGVKQGADIKLIAEGVLNDLGFVFFQLRGNGCAGRFG